MDDIDNDESAPYSPSFRIWLCGTFRVERRVGNGYEPVRTTEWGGSSYPRLLLKALLCCPGRQARRDALLDMLWPDAELEQAVQNLNTAVTRLRKVIAPSKGEASLLLTDEDSHVYRLETQSLLWVDADAALALIKEAERRGRSTLQSFPLLEKAVEYLNQGTFLADEEGLWLYGRRGDLDEAYYNGRLWLADAYAGQGMIGQTELLWRALLDEDPTDEDVLRRAMVCLHEYGMTRKALRLYQQVSKRVAQDGLQLTNATKKLEEHLRAQQNTPLPEIIVQETSFGAHSTERNFSQREEPLNKPTEPYPHLWSVPYQRNPFFTGREELLTRLHTLLHEEENVIAAAPYALCGLGGIGKTQIVLEYAYRFSSEYRMVAWIKADTREHIIADWLALATLLNLPEQAAQNQEVTIPAVKRWLSEHTHWLLIFDNADDLALTQAFLPERAQGHTLLTTRAQATGRIAHRIEVEEMDLDIGALFLLRRTGVINPHASLEDALQRDRATAQEIVQILGGLPLALDQAGAYIEETAFSLQEYIQLYQKQYMSLLKRRGGLVLDHPEPVATTWSLSFARLEKMDFIAADMLRLCAFLDPDAIAEELLIKGAAKVCPSLSSLAADGLRFSQAIEVLRKFSFIRRNPESKMLTLHRLVQSVMRGEMDQETQRLWATWAIQTVYAAFPSDITLDCWVQCQRFLPHAQMCVLLTDTYQSALQEAATLFNQVGYYLRERAFFAEAEPFYQKALVLRQQLLGRVHPDTAQVLYNMARLYYDLGQYNLCEKFHLQALEIREQTLPADHLAIALSMNSLAFLYYIQTYKLEEAERLYQRALPIFDAAIGMDHPKTAHCLSNLALLYTSQGKDTDAERLLLRVQTIRETYLGPMHLDTARSLQNLAWFYIDQGKQERYEEAKHLLERSLAIRKTLLGSEHPQVAISLNHLALLCEAREDYTQAKQFYHLVLAIRRKMMGRDNPKVLLTEASYATLLRKMGMEEEAAQLEVHIQTVRHST